MSAVDQELRDIEAIKQLKARYFRYMDTKRWADMRRQFTDDARFDGTNVTTSVDAFIAALAERHRDAVTVHHGHMPEIALTGADTARGIWAMYDWVEHEKPIAPGGRAAGYLGFIGFGHYEEEYRREGGAWKISFLRLTRIRVNPVSQPQLMLKGWLPTSPEDWLLAAAKGGASR